MQEHHGEASRKNYRTKGQGETEGGHQTPETGEHILVYQYPDSGSAVKQPALELLEPSITPARPSQEQFEEHLLQQGLEGLAMGDNNDNNAKTNATITTFELPIGDVRGKAPMKNIPLSSLPSFQGMTVEDLDTFLFEFHVLCRTYDYTIDA